MPATPIHKEPSACESDTLCSGLLLNPMQSSSSSAKPDQLTQTPGANTHRTHALIRSTIFITPPNSMSRLYLMPITYWRISHYRVSYLLGG